MKKVFYTVAQSHPLLDLCTCSMPSFTKTGILLLVNAYCVVKRLHYPIFNLKIYVKVFTPYRGVNPQKPISKICFLFSKFWNSSPCFKQFSTRFLSKRWKSSNEPMKTVQLVQKTNKFSGSCDFFVYSRGVAACRFEEWTVVPKRRNNEFLTIPHSFTLF